MSILEVLALMVLFLGFVSLYLVVLFVLANLLAGAEDINYYREPVKFCPYCYVPLVGLGSETEPFKCPKCGKMVVN